MTIKETHPDYETLRDVPPMETTDYTDPRCPFCTDAFEKDTPPRRVPIDRIMARANAYFAADDYAGAERHYDYWLREAEEGRDDRGLLFLYNEQMGLFRKTGQKEKALDAVSRAMRLLEKMEMTSSITAGTTYVNAGTVYKRFGMTEPSLACFERALPLYEAHLAPDDGRLGGLYNNMALTLTDAGRFDEAEQSYRKALRVMEQVPDGGPERAITYLNLANLEEARLGLEEAAERIEEDLNLARELLFDPSNPHDGNFAFVCEKCAPTFTYYGYFADGAELARTAQEIYKHART